MAGLNSLKKKRPYTPNTKMRDFVTVTAVESIKGADGKPVKTKDGKLMARVTGTLPDGSTAVYVDKPDTGYPMDPTVIKPGMVMSIRAAENTNDAGEKIVEHGRTVNSYPGIDAAFEMQVGLIHIPAKGDKAEKFMGYGVDTKRAVKIEDASKITPELIKSLVDKEIVPSSDHSGRGIIIQYAEVNRAYALKEMEKAGIDVSGIKDGNDIDPVKFKEVATAANFDLSGYYRQTSVSLNVGGEKAEDGSWKANDLDTWSADIAAALSEKIGESLATGDRDIVMIPRETFAMSGFVNDRTKAQFATSYSIMEEVNGKKQRKTVLRRDFQRDNKGQVIFPAGANVNYGVATMHVTFKPAFAPAVNKETGELIEEGLVKAAIEKGIDVESMRLSQLPGQPVDMSKLAARCLKAGIDIRPFVRGSRLGAAEAAGGWPYAVSYLRTEVHSPKLPGARDDAKGPAKGPAEGHEPPADEHVDTEDHGADDLPPAPEDLGDDIDGLFGDEDEQKVATP